MDWEIDKENKIIHWNFRANSQDMWFSVSQPLNEFINTVKGLYNLVLKMEQDDGLDVNEALKEVQTLFQENQVKNCELRSSLGQLVGLTDKVYQITGLEMIVDEVVLKGELRGTLLYNGRQVEVEQVGEMIGLLVDGNGARGPVWKQVKFKVLDGKKATEKGAG